MQVKDLGEEKFIQKLCQKFSVKLPLVGIGDDCAVIPASKNDAWLVTTDALVEDIHFIKKQIPPAQLAYKSIAVNVSDIAAMGGRPLYAFLTIALPKNTKTTWLENFIKGLKEACDKWNIKLLGGDTVGSKNSIFINVTLIGRAIKSKIKYRHQAKTGDIICVTGCLGDSGGGLKALAEGLKKDKLVKALIQAHFHPEPNIAIGQWLGTQRGVHAMMDLSDGLDCDLKRLIKASKCAAVIETTTLPISNALDAVARKNNWDSLELALTDGEDYVLLLTIDRNSFTKIKLAFKKQFSHQLFEIGFIIEDQPNILYLKKQKKLKLNYSYFKHFTL